MGKTFEDKDRLTRRAQTVAFLSAIAAVPLFLVMLLGGDSIPIWVPVLIVVLGIVLTIAGAVEERHRIKSVSFWTGLVLFGFVGGSVVWIRWELEDRNVDDSVIMVLVAVFAWMSGFWVIGRSVNEARWTSKDYRQDRYRDLTHALVTGLVFGVISVLAQK